MFTGLYPNKKEITKMKKSEFSILTHVCFLDFGNCVEMKSLSGSLSSERVNSSDK
jgi:hypothetical protein